MFQDLIEHVAAARLQPVPLKIRVEEGLGQNIATGLLAAGLALGPMATTPVEAKPKVGHTQKKHRGLPHRAYTDQEKVNAMIGEAGGEGYAGMLAVAHVIRNRAHDSYYKDNVLHGVYGKNAAHIKTEPQSVKNTALKAWKDSINTPDPTHGAIVWGNRSDVESFKRQPWFKNVELTAQIGGHYFFRKKSKA